MSRSTTGTDGQSPRVVLGAVSFLNTKPLVAGLVDDPQVRLEYAVPSELGGWLHSGRVDAALIPVVDLTSHPPVKPVSDACISSDGETLTVRVFSGVPPSRVRGLRADGDSHTSVVLAKLMWAELFGRVPTVKPLEPLADPGGDDGVLLIGDKVVALRPKGFAFEMDLGAVWRRLTGLPFVYAVWAMRSDRQPGDLPRILSASRDAGVARAAEIAEREGPLAGWPVEIARRYLTEYMEYRLTDRHRQGMSLFLRKAAEHDLLPTCQEGTAREGAA